MDNSTTDTSDFDLELLNADFEVPDLQGMGIDIPNITVDSLDGDEEDLGVQKKLLRCPVCGHINEEKAFKNYEDTE